MNHIFPLTTKILLQDQEIFSRSSSGRKMHGNIFSFLYFSLLREPDLKLGACHVGQTKISSFCSHLCVTFHGKNCWGTLCRIRKMMFSLERFWRNVEIIFAFNRNWQRTSTSPEK